MSAIKKNLLYFGAIIVLVLAVVAFVFIPALGGSAKGKTISFGKWNGKPVEYVQDSYIIRQMQALTEQVQQQGQELDQYTYYQIMQSAFRAAIVRLAILDSIKTAGYAVPESVVNKRLVNYYIDESGRYSQKRFNETPETTRAKYRNQLTEDLNAQRFAEDMLGSQGGHFGLKTSSKEIDLIKSMASPERSFEYVSFSIENFPQTEVAAWGKVNSELFVKHNLSVITAETEAIVKKAGSAIKNGEVSFEDAVTTWSTRNGTDAEGNLQSSYRKDLNNLLADAKDLETVLALGVGETSGIIKIGSSFALIRCNGNTVEPDFSNATVLAAATSYMKNNEKGKIEDYFMNLASVFVENARKEGFDIACSTAELDKKTTSPFGLNYGNKEIMSEVPSASITEFAGAEKNEKFLLTAFGLEAGSISEPVLIGSNFIILKLLEEKAADPQMQEMMPMFYNYYASSWAESTLSAAFLSDKKLEDNFMKTYLEHFLN